MSDEEDNNSDAPAGLPAWVMTFADLMSLLMCFFVLLLSFSQMDLSKFKKVAGSMERAFGIQRDIVAYEIPKGTSVIAREFTPGKPEPTMVKEIRQKTIDELRQTLEFDKIRTQGINENKSSMQEVPDMMDRPTIIEEQEKTRGAQDGEKEAKAKEIAERIAEATAQDILEGNIEVEAHGQRVIVRIMERGSFESGLARLKPEFRPIVLKLNNILKNVPGDITVSGHTDNIPIYNSQFRSNWSLSAQRAVEVAHAILELGEVEQRRISVAGFADTMPLFPNDTADNRRKNRRVEIIIVQGDRPDYRSLDTLDTDSGGDGKPYSRKTIDYNPATDPVRLMPKLETDNIKLDYDSFRNQNPKQYKSLDDYRQQ